MIGADLPPAHAVPERHEIAIANADKRHVGMFQESKEFSGDQDVTGYEIPSSGVNT
jgi:hypothetical protein